MNIDYYGNKIWDILISECGASNDEKEREQFLSTMKDWNWTGGFPYEYLFIGKLGSGSKIHISDKARVSCYNPNVKRNKMMERANKQLALLNQYFIIPKCFKCEKELCTGDKHWAWDMPMNAVVFHGGGNYGSSLYDSLVNEIGVRIIICDDCLKKYKDMTQDEYNPSQWLGSSITKEQCDNPQP